MVPSVCFKVEWKYSTITQFQLEYSLQTGGSCICIYRGEALDLRSTSSEQHRLARLYITKPDRWICPEFTRPLDLPPGRPYIFAARSQNGKKGGRSFFCEIEVRSFKLILISRGYLEFATKTSPTSGLRHLPSSATHLISRSSFPLRSRSWITKMRVIDTDGARYTCRD